MKRLLSLFGAIFVGLLICVLVVYMGLRKENPDVLLSWLKKGKGNQEEILMRLNMARGDVEGAMIKAFGNPRNPLRYRAQVLELLFKRNYRIPSAKSAEAFEKALKDPVLELRLAAVQGYAVYGDDKLQLSLIPLLTDSAVSVRKQVYTVFTESDRLWQAVSDSQRTQIVRAAIAGISKEADGAMRDLARMILGRQSTALVWDAYKSFQTANVSEGDSLIHAAVGLDTTNQKPKIAWANYYLSTNRKRALEIAKQYGGLLEIPRLANAPIIDGDPSETSWKGAYVAEKFLNCTEYIPLPAQGKTRCFMGHRNGKVYIAVIGYEDRLDKIVARYKNRDENVWKDDCVEIVFFPKAEHEEDTRKYYQFCINALGGLFDQYNGDSKKNFPCEYAAKIFKDRGYWACEFAIDGKDLDSNPITSGSLWRMDVFRTRIGPASEQSALWPTFGGTSGISFFPLVVFKG